MKKTLLVPILMGIRLAAMPAAAADHQTLMVFSFRPSGPQFTGTFNANGVLGQAGSADSTVCFDEASGIRSASKTIHLAGGDMGPKSPFPTTE